MKQNQDNSTVIFDNHNCGRQELDRQINTDWKNFAEVSAGVTWQWWIVTYGKLIA